MSRYVVGEIVEVSRNAFNKIKSSGKIDIVKMDESTVRYRCVSLAKYSNKGKKQELLQKEGGCHKKMS